MKNHRTPDEWRKLFDAQQQGLMSESVVIVRVYPCAESPQNWSMLGSQCAWVVNIRTGLTKSRPVP
nr:hypothetical protein 49p1_00009 [Yersinia frederiksenii]